MTYLLFVFFESNLFEFQERFVHINSSMINKKTSCIILSGGTSSRMGVHKALLKFSDTENFLQHIVNVYLEAGIKKIIVVKNFDIYVDSKSVSERVTMVNNYTTSLGRLYSIRLGLSAAPGSEFCFIQNVDNPFVSGGLIRGLYQLRSEANSIVPVYNGLGGHPVLLSRKAIDGVLGALGSDQSLRQILAGYSRKELSVDSGEILRNFNTPSEYNDVFATV